MSGNVSLQCTPVDPALDEALHSPWFTAVVLLVSVGDPLGGARVRSSAVQDQIVLVCFNQKANLKKVFLQVISMFDSSSFSSSFFLINLIFLQYLY